VNVLLNILVLLGRSCLELRNLACNCSFLYWTENSGNNHPGKVWRARLDGENEQFVYGEMIAPSAIHIDYASK